MISFQCASLRWKSEVCEEAEFHVKLSKVKEQCGVLFFYYEYISEDVFFKIYILVKSKNEKCYIYAYIIP